MQKKRNGKTEYMIVQNVPKFITKRVEIETLWNPFSRKNSQKIGFGGTRDTDLYEAGAWNQRRFEN